MYSIDLNSDMGESFGAYKIGGDEEIIKYVTTANVACGWHAGDPMVMDKVVRMAKERGVMVGAHPGYPDMMGFGRRKMVLSHDEIKNYVRYQIGALAAFTKSCGRIIVHLKNGLPCSRTRGPRRARSWPGAITGRPSCPCSLSLRAS